MQKSVNQRKLIKKRLCDIQKITIERGINTKQLSRFDYICNYESQTINNKLYLKIIACIVALFILILSYWTVNIFISIRCLLPSNYLVWEATRPLADCDYCANVTKPIILRNASRQSFSKYAYSSRPIIVKNAIHKWKVGKVLDFNTLKALYTQTEGSYEGFDEGCQFLNFKTDMFTLKDVFNMPEDRVKNIEGQDPWYVGWSICHPAILNTIRQYYNVPEFLPEDAEYPANDNIFYGYELGAVMHLDYVPRLMWQGQVHGNKSWSIAPVPECDDVCQKFNFYVEPGDIVLMDTRVWYHSTEIQKGELSLTVQSEYG